MKYIYDQPNNKYLELSPLYLAVKSQNDEIVNLLLENQNIDINNINIEKLKNCKISQKTVLHEAIINDKIDIVSSILDYSQIDINKRSFSKIINKDSVEENEFPPLYFALKNKNLEIISLLLSHPKFDFSSKSTKSFLSESNFFIEEKSLLQLAISIDDANLVQFLMDLLQKNNKISDDLGELLKMTNNNQIKSIIYSFINKLN